MQKEMVSTKLPEIYILPSEPLPRTVQEDMGPRLAYFLSYLMTTLFGGPLIFAALKHHEYFFAGVFIALLLVSGTVVGWWMRKPWHDHEVVLRYWRQDCLGILHRHAIELHPFEVVEMSYCHGTNPTGDRLWPVKQYTLALSYSPDTTPLLWSVDVPLYHKSGVQRLMDELKVGDRVRFPDAKLIFRPDSYMDRVKLDLGAIIQYKL